MFKEFVRCLGAYALYFRKLRIECLLTTYLPMKVNGKTVCFIPHPLEQAKRFGSFVDMQGVGVFRKIDLLEPFGNADDGDLSIKAELFECLGSGRQLALPSVDQDQVWHWLVFFQ